MKEREMRWRCEEFIHVGKDCGREQIGKRVKIDNCYGTVVDGSELFITVKWDFWSWVRRRVKSLPSGSRPRSRTRER